MPDMSESERRPAECPGGHAYIGGEYLVGWQPCGCTGDITGTAPTGAAFTERSCFCCNSC
jgi:hypothetical protein